MSGGNKEARDFSPVIGELHSWPALKLLFLLVFSLSM
jgi:hypothetical protein